LATGARERPRSARLVPGSRPAGVYTTGQLQQAVYLYHQPIGRRALVVGAEHVSYSAAVTLHHAGARVAAMVTDLPHQQSYVAFRIGAGLRYRFPVLTDTAVVRLLGKPRLEAVELRRGNGTIETVAVDTVVFTGDWVPDHELARAGGVVLDDGSLGPVVDTTLRTSVPGVFAAGNVVHPVETADVVAIDGRYVAESVARWLSGDRPPASSARRLVVQEPLRWVAPGCVAPTAPPPPRNRFILWTAQFVHRPTFVVVQDGRVLQVQRHRTPLVPNRPAYLSAQWWGEVDPRGGDVSIAVA
jgi:pyruvate/2-oxoglutarate dehydrogenase complex dihydrolipoamide dehydrogenase (E3) component